MSKKHVALKNNFLKKNSNFTDFLPVFLSLKYSCYNLLDTKNLPQICLIK